MNAIKKKDIIYEIRCFKDGKRVGTNKFSKSDAKCFRKTAKHLAKFLTEAYKLKE